jgi:Phosphotransferase enzyme family
MRRGGPGTREGGSPGPAGGARTVTGPHEGSVPATDRSVKLEAGRIAAALTARTGVPLVVEGPCPGGQVGAAYVRWPDGHRAVLTWRPGISLAGARSGPLAVPAALRATGYPAPATELAAHVGDGVAVVQELLPGTAVRHVDTAILDQALRLSTRHAGVLAGHPQVPAYRLYLCDDGPGYCLHEPLRRFSPRAADLERRIAAVGRDHPDRLAGDDAVHGDFHHENFLARDGRLTGVIDWDGAGRGDRRFDLVTLRFGLRPGNSTAAARQRLDRILDDLPDELLRPAWAHMGLRMADWAIRHFDPAAVPYWLGLAGQRLP